MGDYRKLQVWERAHRLTLEVYGATQSFPKVEMYGLTNQLRRAASSVPANIAEGCGRNGDAELARFLDIAKGSATELDYHLILARDLSYLQPAQYERLATEVAGVSRMLAALSAQLRKTKRPSPIAHSPRPPHSTISTAIPSGAQSYNHAATSRGTLTQPWLIGVPKFSCQ